MQSDQAATFFKTYHAGKSPTIIMLHGFRGTHQEMYPIARSLGKCRVIIPDLPGHGQTPPLQQEHSISNLIPWLHSFIENLQLDEPPILAGYSLGGVLAAYYAMDYPNTISKLILIAPLTSPTGKREGSRESRAVHRHYNMGYLMPSVLARSWFTSPALVGKIFRHMATSSSQKTRQSTKDLLHRVLQGSALPRVVKETHQSFLHRHIGEVSEKINVSTLYIYGNLDTIAPIADQLAASRRITYVQNVQIDNAGHLIPYENAAEAAHSIQEFVK